MTEKNKGGRPPKYNSPEELEEMINGYFDGLVIYNAEAKEQGWDLKHPTVTGLAIAVDLTRTGLIEYCDKNEEYSNTIRKAKAKIEEYVEQRLYGNNVTGLIFNLKNNYGWKDKRELESHNTGEMSHDVKITKELVQEAVKELKDDF